MAYEKLGEFIYDDLPIETKYRFAELEINKALSTLAELHYSQQDKFIKAENMLTRLLFPIFIDEETETAFLDATRYHSFRRPPKNELIVYLLFHQQSYKTIQTLAHTAPNTIANYRYEVKPYFYPVYNKWNEDMLIRWETIKPCLNLWKETLIHTK